MRIPTLALALLAVLGVATPAAAWGDAGAIELRVPPPIPDGSEALRAKLVEALDEALRPGFFAVVAAANVRLLASRRAAESSGDEPITAREAARAALVQADFARITTQEPAVLEAAIDMTVLQMGADLHAALRDGVGRRQAIRAVRACGTRTACLDAIAATETMTAAHIAAVRAALAGKGKELAAQDRLGGAEIERMSATFKTVATVLSNVSKTRAEISMTFARNARA